MAAARASKRYAKALIGLAVEKSAVEAIQEDMNSLIELCKNSREFVVMLESPIVTHEKKLTVLEKIFQGKVHEITMAFFKLITTKSREASLLDIAKAYITLYNENIGLAIAEVQSAVPLTNEVRTSITQQVATATGKNIQLKETINEDLIGGFILRLDDKQIDSSVKSQLLNLKKQLN